MSKEDFEIGDKKMLILKETRERFQVGDKVTWAYNDYDTDFFKRGTIYFVDKVGDNEMICLKVDDVFKWHPSCDFVFVE